MRPRRALDGADPVLVTGDEDERFLPDFATAAAQARRRLSASCHRRGWSRGPGLHPAGAVAGSHRDRTGRTRDRREPSSTPGSSRPSSVRPCPPHPPTSLAEAVREAHRSRIVVLGGTEPGHTTDGIAGLLAERLRAQRLVNATRVPGLFERDPRKDPSARRIDRLDYVGFRKMIDASVTAAAGQQFVFDRLGLESLARAKIPLRIVQGRDLDNLEQALRGEDFVGTEIR